MLDQNHPDHAQALATLLHVDNVPLEIATVLISQGLRFSHHQLVAAARQGIKGVAVWVKAYHQLDIPTALPPHLDLALRYHIPQVTMHCSL